MLIAIIGENCVGKSTLAHRINERLCGKIYSGKDYLRLERNPLAALEAFKALLTESVTGENVIYLITETEHLKLLPDGAFKIVLTADIEVIKERFKARMKGVLPPPVEKMLEQKHGTYDNLECSLKLDGNYNINEIFDKLNLS